MADFLLFSLNIQENFEYVPVLKLKKPTNDVRVAMAEAAINLGFHTEKRDVVTGKVMRIQFL